MSSRKYTTESLIEKIKEIHKDKYDTSLCQVGRNVDTNVTLICHKEAHGLFEKTPYQLINRKHGCPLCSKRPRIDTAYFKILAKQVHGDRYNYDKVEYVNQKTNIIITCRIHGDFNCSPPNHINKKRGCPHCNGGIKLQWEDVLKRCIEIHGEKYDYSKFKYTNYQTKSTIICKIHGEFEQHLNNHLNCKKGCRKCSSIINSDKQRYSVEDFIKKAKEVHGDIFDYSQFEYINNHTPSTIICPYHGKFQQNMTAHLKSETGCRKCSGIKYTTLEEAIIIANNIHKNRYTYNNFNYVNSGVPSFITCKKHGDFKCAMGNHINSKRGCPHCLNKTEGILKLILKDNFNYKIICNRGFDWCKKKNKLRYDFIIEDLKIIIELDGLQHFEKVCNWKTNPDKQLQNDIFKNECAMKNGYTIIRVFQEDIYKDKKDILLKLILSIHRYATPQLICIGEIYENRF